MAAQKKTPGTAAGRFYLVRLRGASVADFDAAVTPAVAVPETLPFDVADRAVDVFRRRRDVDGGRLVVARLAVGDGAADDGAGGQSANDARGNAATAAVGLGARGQCCGHQGSR